MRTKGEGDGWSRQPLNPAMVKVGLTLDDWVYRKEIEDGVLIVICSPDRGSGFHLSISHQVQGQPGRYPGWDEIIEARERFTPDSMSLVMHLPTRAEYVNLHNTTFHLWEIEQGYCEHCDDEPPPGTTCPKCYRSTPRTT
ncbi:MAG TPA: hypothetical protein VIT65_23175 [Microlunatus sp.]